MNFARCRLAVAAALLGMLTAWPGHGQPDAPPAPDFVLKSIDGSNLRLSEFRGQVVLLSFFASWCGECRAQLRGLADLYSRYQGAGFELLAVSLDRERRQAGDAIEAIDPDFPVLHDLGQVVGAEYEVESMPLVILIDREGKIRGRIEGYRRGAEDEYIEQVRVLLNE
jgi:peroxiredoxin